jgi:multiple sugar transport system permease protein
MPSSADAAILPAAAPVRAPVARARAGWFTRHRRRIGDAATILLLLLVLFPFLWLVQMSFRPNDDIFGYALGFTPTLEHYGALWSGSFPRSFVNSAVVSLASTGLALLIGVPAAYALSRARFRHGRQIALWILATRMAPPIAFTIPFFLAYRYIGLLDTQIGLIIVYLTFNLALVIWLMQTFFEGVPASLEEAAWIDGCGVWQAFLRVSLPLSAPGLAAAAVLCFILSWNDFFFALVLTRTNASTAPVAIVNFIQYTGWEWGRITAAATLVMLPVVVFSLVVRNWLVRGLTAGGTKE